MVAVATLGDAQEAPRYVAQVGGTPIRAAARSERFIGWLEQETPVPLRTCAECTSSIYLPVEPRGFVDVRQLERARAPREPRPHRLARLPRTTTVYTRRDTRSTVSRQIRGGYVVALYDTPDAEWFERPNGGYIRATDVRFLTPSTLRGVAAPTLPLAFFVAQYVGTTRTAERYERTRVVGAVTDEAVETELGSVPRSSVRIAKVHARPSAVAPDGKWVHVDTAEQTLVLYEGDTPVYATLVRTGSPLHPTARGLHVVYQMTRDATMEGDDASYRVEHVEHILYFRDGYALHAAFWHDGFGSRGSHGCVNLAPADAEFVYGWAPFQVPPGWQSVFPRTLGEPSLHVLVDEELTPEERRARAARAAGR